MRPDDVMKALSAANPLPTRVAAALPVQAAEAEMLGQIVAEPPVDSAVRQAVAGMQMPRRRPLHRRGVRRSVAVAVVAACVALGLVAFLPSGERGGVGVGPAPAYAASLVRFANSTPRLLLQLPGWRVSFVEPDGNGSGEMHFISGPHSESLDNVIQLNWAPVTSHFEQVFRAHGGNAGGGASGLPEVRLLDDLAGGIGMPTSGMESVNIPTGLGVPMRWLYYEDRSKHSIDVTTYTFYDHLIIRFRVLVANLAGLKAVLAGLKRVDIDTWLKAMPASVIKHVQSGAAIKQMLEGIPLPPGFDASTIPGVHNTQTNYYLASELTGAVACGWFADWYHARAIGDRSAERRALAAMLTAPHWPVFRWMSRQGAWPSVLIQIGQRMAHNSWGGVSQFDTVNGGLGCSSLGVKLMH